MNQTKGFEESGKGASNPLQDDKANGDGNDLNETTVIPSAPPGSPESTPESLSTPSSQSTSTPQSPITSQPSTRPLEELNLSVGNTAPFDYGKKLFNQLNELKTVYIDTSSQLCNVYSKTSINDITVDDIKKSNKLQKKDLGELLLNVLNKCSYLCFDTNLESITNFKYDTQFQNISSELSKCVQTSLEKYSESQDVRLKNIEAQVNKLNFYKNFLNSNSSSTQFSHDNAVQAPNTDHEVMDVTITNPTTHIEDSTNNFLSTELTDNVTEFLNGCDNFNENCENGHKVTMFGYPYNYNGSKHQNQISEIPGPIKEILDVLHEKYPDAELNSCLVNKYQGPQSCLPKHSDDEATIAPDSIICTVSLGHTCTVKFTETHGQQVQEHAAESNSLYVMSKKSQSYWQHEIKPCAQLSEDSVRYSLTFRHVDKKYLKSAIIFGDSNTRNLKFGSGKGTFGHNMPGKREESIHISNIEPEMCCGYKNILIHCGINDIKHHRVNNNVKVTQKFDELKCKVDEISVLCPSAKLFVSPILPTKSQEWNRRALHFNRLLFDFCNESNGRIVAPNFNDFCDQFGNLRNDMGKYWNPSDPLHLGSKGISTLVKIIRQCVFSSSVNTLSYSNAITGHSVSNRSGHVVAQSGHPGLAAT